MKSFNFIFFLKEGKEKKEIGRKEETFKKNFGFSEADYILKEFLSEYYKKEVKNSGLKHVFTGNTYSSFKKDGGTTLQRGCAIYDTLKKEEEDWGDEEIVFSDQTKINDKIGFIAYPKGYVLNVGRTKRGLFGEEIQMFYKTFGGRNLSSCNKDGCRYIKNLAAMKKLLESKKEIFSYFTENHNYNFSVEYGNSFFEEEEKERFSSLSEKRKGKEEELKKEINILLDEINNASKKEREIVYGRNPEEEAIQRMSELDFFSPVMKRFKESGKLFQSESSGILYDLDEKAFEACKKVSEDGNLPFHVVKNETNMGELYSVLFVEKEREEWEMSRKDLLDERIVFAYVYNATNPELSEYEDISVVPANGGIMRVN